MDRTDKSLVGFSLITVLMMLLLVVVGESRPDAYIAVAIVLYFIYTAIDPVLRRVASIRILDIALILVFMLIVAIRVLTVLNII